MKKIIFEEQLMPYPAHLLPEWKKRNYTFLQSSSASEFIKDILITKARVRPGTRFFGEAYVASIMSDKMKNGWYSSYKWLTTKKWISGKQLTSRFEKPFYKALQKHIGVDKLKEIQHQAVLYYKKNNVKPQAPDLWFVDKKDKHTFYEVKKGTDRIHEGQLEGLAILRKYLNADVSVVALYPDNLERPEAIDHTQRFSDIYTSI